METGINALGNLPRESMLTYGVLFGQQIRRHDPYALGAQITDLAARGCISIHGSKHDMHDLILQVHPGGDMLEEEEVFVSLLQNNSTPGHGVALKTLTHSKDFTNDMQVLWKRVVMMHHTNYNKDRPLYNADPTRLVTWQRFRRTLGWLLAVGSVYAEPGWQGRIAGLAEIQSGYEEPELLAATPAGRALIHRVVALRKQMLRLADSGELGDAGITTYERALPFAFLFDDDLKKKWPVFLSRHYTHYPSWLAPGRPATTKAHRQGQIATMLDVMGTLYFPARKRRATPL